MPYGQASAVSAWLRGGHGIASAWFSEHAAQAVQACRLLSLTMVAGSRIRGVSKGLTCDG